MPEKVKFLDETVFPSKTRSIQVYNTDDGYGGAHHYVARLSDGFENGKAKYCDMNLFLSIFFVQKLDDGHVISGIQNEQLIIILKDRIKKLNAKFPHPENEVMLKALDDFLAASQRRVEERMNRGVMGELKQ